MNQGPLIFLGLLAALATAWFGMVVQPQFQLGRASPGTNSLDPSVVYPKARPGLAQQGLQVYRSLGCATCHTRQVRQVGMLLDVVLTDIGTNTPAVVEAVASIRNDLPLPEIGRLIERLPAIIESDMVDPNRAAASVKSLTEVGAKARTELLPQGPDIVRGWGQGRTVAADFLYDQPALPGSIRLGPDLANVGARLPSAEWHYRHLFDPTSTTPRSVMPPYRFLFERPNHRGSLSPQALDLPMASALTTADGQVIVPTPEARALVAFLLSLRSDVPLIERPVAGAGGLVTVSPATDTNAVTQPSATNAPPS